VSEHTDAAAETTAEPITVYSDYVCPFCYLGRTALTRYQERREEPLAIDWHPFDLRAGQRGLDGEIDHSVDDGKDEAYYEQARENVRRLQERYGVEMDLEIAEDVDSRATQIASVGVRERVDYETWLAYDEALLAALWEDGRDVGDPEVLTDVADEVEIDPDLVASALTDDDLESRVESAFDEARDRGVTGVPTFVYDDHVARGAVPPEQLRRLVEGV
jgi:predicted DsbA family dithiol-disulfide isomerase